MNEKEHWEAVYRSKAAEEVSWYSPHLGRSLQFIEEARLPKDAAILDVGGGASTLVDDLLLRGYRDITVLDISSKAMEGARKRLGEQAARVTWIVADVTHIALPEHRFDFWHDRAVFHFLKGDVARAGYVASVRRGLKPGGHIVVATFGPSGPEQCSGLVVKRYDADELHGEFGRPFEKISSFDEIHLTPWGTEQEFVYCFCRMVD